MLLQGKITIQTFVCTVVFLHKYKQMTLTLVSKMAQFIDFFFWVISSKNVKLWVGGGWPRLGLAQVAGCKGGWGTTRGGWSWTHPLWSLTYCPPPCPPRPLGILRLHLWSIDMPWISCQMSGCPLSLWWGLRLWQWSVYFTSGVGVWSNLNLEFNHTARQRKRI